MCCNDISQFRRVNDIKEVLLRSYIYVCRAIRRVYVYSLVALR